MDAVAQFSGGQTFIPGFITRRGRDRNGIGSFSSNLYFARGNKLSTVKMSQTPVT